MGEDIGVRNCRVLLDDKDLMAAAEELPTVTFDPGGEEEIEIPRVEPVEINVEMIPEVEYCFGVWRRKPYRYRMMRRAARICGFRVIVVRMA